MISPQVIQELMMVRQVLHYLPASPKTEHGWTQQEQQLFWDALAQFPHGPWTTVAEYIGSKSTRQAMTHGQKLRQKLSRWRKRLRRTPAAALALAENSSSPSELLDDDVSASIAFSSAMMASSAMPSMMTPASMAMSMTMPTLATTSPHQQHHNKNGLYIDNIMVLPQYKTRGSAMLTSSGSGLAPITTVGLVSDISYSELLMASLPFATRAEATTCAAFDCMIATMTPTMMPTTTTSTNPSLPAAFVSSERHPLEPNGSFQHHNVRHRPTMATAAPMPFEDDDARYALPQSMVDELADVLWD